MNILNNTISSFPDIRLRRNRSSDWSRRIVAENKVSADDLILPLFVQEGDNKKSQIASMPSVERLSIDLMLEKVNVACEKGIPAVALFPVVPPEKKSEDAKEAYNANNLVSKALSAIKENFSDIGVICDVALDPYTSHGQDGLVTGGKILNDETVDILCRQAVCLAEAGADIVAPSDMMDGRVRAVRQALDNKKFNDVKILSYAAKYASCFYGPFRDAVGSAANLGKADKKTYQMDPANSDEALREVQLDIAEGADMIMVKPGMPYLDIIRRVRDNFNIPILAYQVSGEYAMLKAASQNGWLDEKAAMYESIVAFKRAGASCVFTYAAIEIADNLSKG
ncbi:MAG: porphobilinogen synthase [Alphaproteobacteria bacterium CG11_big_fil_rev_8_21_14_0_20_39_49]|nr:MAG: porphobilinogen synthase [Alphaproteobacteria bacterium CG11_big_fil_rev_8_21_14_0_20_39_49]